MKVEVSLTISLKRSSLHCRGRQYQQSRWREVEESNLGGVHLVNGNDELTNTKGEGQESVLASLTVLGDTGLELTSTTGDDEDSTISLRGTGDHVLDEITVSRGINDLNAHID